MNREEEALKIGFIGCGNMANAIMGGIIRSGLAAPEEIMGADPTEAGRERTRKENGIRTTEDNREVVDQCGTVFLSIKPQYCADVIKEIRDQVRDDQLIISICAGRSIPWLERAFGKRVKLVRFMPNTPALVGEGITAVCRNHAASEEEMRYAMDLCSGFGRAEAVPEHLFDTVTAVSGSGPAYVFMFIEAMADAAVQGGMPRSQAYKFAAQTVLGSARMVLETGKHPGELKDMVTSPAGTTIEAVRVLEERGFRSAVFECVAACREKSEDMGRN